VGRYKVTLTEIDRDRDAAAKQLQEYLTGLGMFDRRQPLTEK